MFEKEDHLKWDDTFMATAKLMALRSKDPATQVGAVLVDKNNKILSLGYNGAPIGFDDKIFPWGKSGDVLNTKFPFVCHAELNAITNYNGDRQKLEESTLYVTLFPCNECAKIIIQSGIKNVVYSYIKHEERPLVEAAKILFKTCGVNCRQYNIENDILIPSEGPAHIQYDKPKRRLKK